MRVAERHRDRECADDELDQVAESRLDLGRRRDWRRQEEAEVEQEEQRSDAAAELAEISPMATRPCRTWSSSSNRSVVARTRARTILLRSTSTRHAATEPNTRMAKPVSRRQ